MKILEYKSITGQIEDIDEKKRIVTGYLSNFDNKDHHGDSIPKGAFAKTLHERKNDIFFLNQHNWAQPHGKFNQLIEDGKGLKFESTPLIDTTYSSDLIKLYAAGIVNEHSIGYQTIKAVNEGDVRILQEIKLFEGSNVTLGANSQTPFTGFKTSMKEINDHAKKLIKAIKNGTFTDETFSLLEVALKQLQSDAYILGKKESLIEPSNDIHKRADIKLINEFTKTLNI